MTPSKRALFLQERFPIWFERIARVLKMPVWAAALLFTGAIGVVFAVSDAVAGLPTQHRVVVVSALLLSIGLALVMLVLVRNKTVAAYRQMLPVLESVEHHKLFKLLGKTFDQRRAVKFALVVAAVGVVHHVILSYLEWGRIWWYTIVDIIVVGFGWWFIVATFLWTCASVAAYSFLSSGRLRFTPTLISRARMCGLESFGTLSVFPSIAWAVVATLGTMSTFDPFVSKEFPELIVAYLALDFTIIAGSMTVVFCLPALGYRAVVLPLKEELSRKLDSLISQVGRQKILTTADENGALRNIYLWQLLSEIEQIKEWPLSFGSSMRFVLSYFIPGSAFIGRLILLLTFHIQIPL